MLRKITFTVFNAAAVLVAIAVAVGLTISGHTLAVEGLLLAMGAILAAVLFAFRLTEGPGPDRLSIWVGPRWFNQQAPPPPKARGELRKAA
jgi:hypothetical protein